MQAQASIRYFLGANSPQGFYSLYDQLIDPKKAKAIYILKGGAGCGKSTLMRRVAQQMEQAGKCVEYIHCSADPESLDGILIPECNCAVVDGTAPHVSEPQFPGVVESYVNLGSCYNRKALQKAREEILTCMDGYKEHYARAYRCLRAASEIQNDIRSTLITKEMEEKAAKRARGILAREIGKCGDGHGRVTKRFLRAVTHRGIVCYYTTAEILCKRIYVLEDHHYSSHLLLSHLLNGAVSAGLDVILCPSPMSPELPEHLLIPSLSLAFVTAPAGLVWGRRPYRRIHMTSMADNTLLQHNKARLRFAQKISSSLTDEAVGSLAQAKAMHDELEALYNPYVDFSKVEQIADNIATEILE